MAKAQSGTRDDQPRREPSGCWPAPSRTRSGIANRRRTSCGSLLREYCPTLLAAFQDLTSSDARATRGLAPTPAAATTLRRPRLRAALARAERRRNLDHQVERILAGLRAEQFRQPELIEQAIRQTARSRICARSMPRCQHRRAGHGCLLAPDRVYRGAHYLTDALGGVVLALSWLPVTYRVVRPDYW